MPIPAFPEPSLRSWAANRLRASERPAWWSTTEGAFGPVGKMICSLYETRSLQPGEIMDAMNRHNEQLAGCPRGYELAGGTLNGFLGGKGGIQKGKPWGLLSRQLMALLMLGDEGLAKLTDIVEEMKVASGDDRTDRIKSYLLWQPLEESSDQVLCRSIRFLLPPSLVPDTPVKRGGDGTSPFNPNDGQRNHRWYFDSAFKSWGVPARNTEARSELRRIAYFAAGGGKHTNSLICRVSGGVGFLQVERTGTNEKGEPTYGFTPSGALTVAAIRAGAEVCFVCPPRSAAEETAQAFAAMAGAHLESLKCGGAASRIRIVTLDSTKSDWMHECWRFVFHSLKYTPSRPPNAASKAFRESEIKAEPLLMLSRDPKYGPCAFPVDGEEIKSFKRFLEDRVLKHLTSTAAAAVGY